MLIIDNAKHHHANLLSAWRQAQEPDFHLAYLPPYSPDLNPLERVWKLVRRICLHNRYLPRLELVMGAVEAQFERWAVESPVLRRLCAAGYDTQLLMPFSIALLVPRLADRLKLRKQALDHFVEWAGSAVRSRLVVRWLPGRLFLH